MRTYPVAAYQRLWSLFTIIVRPDLRARCALDSAIVAGALYHLDFRSALARVGLFLAWTLALTGSLAAAEPPVLPADPPDLADLRERGRAAVREWVVERRAADDSSRPDEAKDLDATLELACFVYNEAGGDVITEVLAESESLLALAQEKTPESRHRARAAANVGDAYERLAGNPTAARRLYQQALRLDPEDEVAQEGLARLELAERIDENKEIEVERLKELEAFWEQEPRALPPERSPFDDVVNP